MFFQTFLLPIILVTVFGERKDSLYFDKTNDLLNCVVQHELIKGNPYFDATRIDKSIAVLAGSELSGKTKTVEDIKREVAVWFQVLKNGNYIQEYQDVF